MQISNQGLNANKSDGSLPLNQNNDRDVTTFEKLMNHPSDQDSNDGSRGSSSSTYTQSQADADAAAFYDATQGGVTGWGTDEKKLFSVLEGKNPKDIDQLRQSFKDHYDQDLDTVINNELSGDDLSRAQALIKGDQTERNGSDIEALKQGLAEDMNGWGTDENRILERLTQATPEQRQNLRNDPALMDQFKNELSTEQFEQVNGLLQGDNAKADAARIHQAMNGFWGADQQQVRDVLAGKSPEEVDAIKAAYQQQTGENLADQVGQWSEAACHFLRDRTK